MNTIPARTIGQRTADDVEALLRARNPLLWIITREELRVERSITEAAAAASYHVRLWDCATGVTDAAGKEVPPGAQAKSPMQALKAIQDARQREVWLLRDMHHFLRDPSVQRTVRSLARSLPSAPRNEARAIIILTPMSEVPPELAGHAIVVQWPMPDRAEIAAILETHVAALDPGAAPDEPDEAYARSRSIFESVSSQLTNGQREAAVDAAVGLSAEEAASCYAKSLVMSRSIDPKAVAGEKKRVIARERVLEWHDPDPRGLDAVGGLDLLKGWLATRKAALSQRARAFGIPAPKGVMLVGVPGCLAEGTRIAFRRGARSSAAGRELLIETLYEKFNHIGRPASPWRADVGTYVQSWDDASGKIVYNDVLAVSESGYRDCLRVVTDIGGEVVCTADHPLLLDDGTWRAAADLHAGDRLLLRGSMKPAALGRPRIYRQRVVIEGLKFHPLAWRKVVIDGAKRYEYQRATRARLVIEARMNALSLEAFIEVLKMDALRAEALSYLPTGYDVHHADEDSSNDSPDNLVVVPHAEHARLHGADAADHFNVEYTREVTVCAVAAAGVRRTFDVSMAEPRSNLVVNDGVIAHNCGKSLTAKAVATAWGVPLLRLDLGALRSKWVGESEANIRKALSVAENVAPCVLWIDEIEKALSGGSGRSDGGIAADTLGSILSWMQEHTTAVFVVATANDVAALPPELLRKGRFDDIFFVDLPTQEERAAILGAALRAHQRDHILFDVRALAAECVDYTGAELAALVPDALLRAFADGEREVTVDDLRAATAGLVPLARTAAEKIARVREWAQSRARRASSTESAQARQGRALDIP